MRYTIIIKGYTYDGASATETINKASEIGELALRAGADEWSLIEIDQEFNWRAIEEREQS
jgi:hypothetical protein